MTSVSPARPETAVTDQPKPPKTAFKMTRQNTATGLMPPPKPHFQFTPGLDYLTQLDQVLILQKVEMILDRVEGASKFILRNTDGQQIFTAEEDSVFWKREVYRTVRPLKLNILNNNGDEIMVLNRPLKGSGCCWSCCKCCFQKIEIMAPKGYLIGYVQQQSSFYTDRYLIKNASGEIVFRLNGPRKTCCFSYDTELSVLTATGEKPIATIGRSWSDQTTKTTMKNYKLNLIYSGELDVTSKALILGATFLMHFLYFEERQTGIQ